MEIAVLIPIVAILSTAWVIVTITKARSQRAERSGGGKQAADAALVRENEELKLAMRRMEERLAVLERIATDPAERTAREIEQLRQG